MKRPGSGTAAMSERTLLRMILREFGSRPHMRLFRNNVGVAVYPDGSRVAYGLCPGSSDLIGFQTILITPEMIGQSIARFVSIEVKGPHTRLKAEQQNFLRVVSKAGGTAIVARSLDDVSKGTA